MKLEKFFAAVPSLAPFCVIWEMKPYDTEKEKYGIDWSVVALKGKP